MRILVADDDEGNRRLLERILELLGHECRAAADGAEAAALAAAERYDLVMVDLHMPDLDGAEAIRRIRAGAPSPLRVVAQSGTVEDQARRELGDVRIDGFLTKPYGIADVERVLAAVAAPAAP